jgi:hypothetical protein
MYGGTPIIRKLVIRTANYPDRLGSSGKFVENSTKLTCLEITGYRTKYSAVLWLLEPQITRGRKVQTQLHTVNSNSRTPNFQSSIFGNKNKITRSFCISGRLAVTINPDKRSSTVSVLSVTHSPGSVLRAQPLVLHSHTDFPRCF